VRELAELLRTRRMATVFVTDDLAEASILFDRCAILDADTILQDEPVPTLLRRSRTSRVAEIVGIENVTQQGL
jgi:ABC-type sulfate/molybdate transport systems ATPase subunit